MHLGAWTTQGAPRSSRQSGVVAVLQIGTHTPPNPRIAFRRAPPYGGILNRVPPYGAIQTRFKTRPKPCAEARARRAKPGAEGAGKAERSECRAREDYGRGWAGRCQQAVPANPPKIRPPNTRGSTSQSATQSRLAQPRIPPFTEPLRTETWTKMSEAGLALMLLPVDRPEQRRTALDGRLSDCLAARYSSKQSRGGLNSTPSNLSVGKKGASTPQARQHRCIIGQAPSRLPMR